MHCQWGVHPLVTPQLSETAGSEGITTATLNGTGRFVACTHVNGTSVHMCVSACTVHMYLYTHAQTQTPTHMSTADASTDSAHPVFGKVSSGMEVVKKIEEARTDANDNPVEPIKMISVRMK